MGHREFWEFVVVLYFRTENRQSVKMGKAAFRFAKMPEPLQKSDLTKAHMLL
jgi:hypothetical protein